MTFTELYQLTDTWVQAVLDMYKGRDIDELTQVFMRGPFAGWSEHQLYSFAKRMDENSKLVPLFKLNDEGEKEMITPHKCPKCNGTGWLPYNPNSPGVETSAAGPLRCNACANGIIYVEQPESAQYCPQKENNSQ